MPVENVPGSSPHTRGAQVQVPLLQRRARIIPAYAGSTLFSRDAIHQTRDHPRIRGEHLAFGAILRQQRGSSPHTRGAPCTTTKSSPVVGIIPAYAGSTSPRRSPACTATDHPRIRGEHRRDVSLRPMVSGSSPHTRGARSSMAYCILRSGIIPAYAGSTRRMRPRRRHGADHPRIRGEHGEVFRVPEAPVGSSPHTRGALHRRQAVRQAVRIIPAYAGSTRGPRFRGGRRGDHPRIRGEHLYMLASASERVGSSPHTRGALVGEDRAEVVVGIIPAYAGSTGGPRSRRRLYGDHPRIRGEHSVSARSCATVLGSSPHTRGAPPSHSPPMDTGRIIPAYAGSTAPTAGIHRRNTDHPRIRGEHRGFGVEVPAAGGSSPHTRGARLKLARWHDAVWIIPAYAGSTIRRQIRPCHTPDHPRIRGEHVKLSYL